MQRDRYPAEIFEFDSMINDALSIILDLDLQTPALRETLGQPINLGGMGITSACIIARASFYANRNKKLETPFATLSLGRDVKRN
jgi:hypothetical protein